MGSAGAGACGGTARVVTRAVKQRGAGARRAARQVPETLQDSILEKANAKQAKAEFGDVPVATFGMLKNFDAIIVGTPTRFGDMCGQMRTFWDQTGPLWAKGEAKRVARGAGPGPPGLTTFAGWRARARRCAAVTAGLLQGKVGSVFVTTSTQHGGMETTCTATYNTFAHHVRVFCAASHACAVSIPSAHTHLRRHHAYTHTH